MGLLDRLVTDLVKNATGVNARGLVRRVGGKNILLVGGALLAGGLAGEKMGGGGLSGASWAQSPERPSGAAAPPPPPGAPPARAGDSGPAGPADAVPPPPSGSPAASPPPPPPDTPGPAAEPEVPTELTWAIVRTMVAAALADGELSAEEKRLVEKHLEESELDDEQVAQVRRDLVLPAPPKELAALLPEGEDPEAPYRFAAVVTLADGDASETERAWLARLGEALGIDEERRRELEGEVLGGEGEAG